MRLTTPFVDREVRHEFVAGVGRKLKPNRTMRFTNLRDFWTVQRTNSLGFLDREVSGGNLAACRVAIVGDSMVEAREVAIEDKVQAQLEALTRMHLPSLRVIANGFGLWATGQVAQLAIFDKYVRPLAPKLVVLVFHGNDFQDNFTPLKALETHLPADRLPFATAVGVGGGVFSLRQPERGPAFALQPGWRWRLLGDPSGEFSRLVARALQRVEARSWFVRWLAAAGVLQERINHRERLLALRRTHREIFADGWNDLSWIDGMASDEEIWAVYARETLPPPLAAGLDYTAFALAEFKARARRDGFALVLLTTEAVGPMGTALFGRVGRLAEAAQIDVVNLHDYIVGRDARVADASWRTDWHWSPQGHRWAAEALLEYLRANQTICAEPPTTKPSDLASVAVLDP